MSATGSVVLTEQRGAVRHIVLNRPEALNAISDEMVAALTREFRAANADGGTRAIVFRGAGRAFCAGADLKARKLAASEAEARSRAQAIQDVTRAIVYGDVPVVGAIHGWAVGGGFEWALNCDFPIWAESARGFFPEVSWGLFVTGGVSAILPNLIGLQKTKEMLMLGERYGAAALNELGIAWRVAADDALLAEAEAVAERLAGPASARRPRHEAHAQPRRLWRCRRGNGAGSGRGRALLQRPRDIRADRRLQRPLKPLSGSVSAWRRRLAVRANRVMRDLRRAGLTLPSSGSRSISAPKPSATSSPQLSGIRCLGKSSGTAK